MGRLIIIVTLIIDVIARLQQMLLKVANSNFCRRRIDIEAAR